MPWRRERLPTPVFWPREFHGLPWGHKELDMTEQLALHLPVADPYSECWVLITYLGDDDRNEWRRQWQPTPVFLPGESHGQGSLVGCSPWGRKGRTRLSDFTFTFHFPALEKEMAAHSSVLARRIPGMGEPGGLPSMGSHRVGHD